MAERTATVRFQHVIATWALLRRELLGLWVTPLAWGLSFVFLTLQGVSFTLMVDHYNKFSDPSLDAYFSVGFNLFR